MSAGLARVRVEHHGVVRVLVVSGDLDLGSAAEFAQRASRAADGQVERLVLDLAGLRFIDCCGARALAAVTHAVGGDCPVIVRAVRPAVRRVLELLGLDLERQPSGAGQAREHMPAATRAAGPGPDRLARQVQVAWVRARQVRAETRMLAGMVAATEDRLAITFARLAERRPDSAGRLRQLSEDARSEAMRLRDRARADGALAARRTGAGDRDPGAEPVAGPLRARVAVAESGPVVVLTGQADMRSSGELVEILVSHVPRDTRRLVVDVSGLSFDDPAAVRALVMAAKVLRERGGALLLLQPQPAVATALSLLGADQLVASAGQAAGPAAGNRGLQGTAASSTLVSTASRDTAAAPAARGVISVNETRNCEQCRAVFIPRREHARFCSGSCRDSWNLQRGGDMRTGASTLNWTVAAMRDVTGSLAATGAHDRPHAFEAISEAVWWVTMVDATLNRHHLTACDNVIQAQPAAERQLIEGTLSGLRFVRNQMGYHVEPADFIEPAPGHPGGADGPVTAWSWRSLPEPAFAWLPPGGRAWEMTRYQAYEAQLAGHSIGETFARAAAFLKLASARATRHAQKETR